MGQRPGSWPGWECCHHSCTGWSMSPFLSLIRLSPLARGGQGTDSAKTPLHAFLMLAGHEWMSLASRGPTTAQKLFPQLGYPTSFTCTPVPRCLYGASCFRVSVSTPSTEPSSSVRPSGPGWMCYQQSPHCSGFEGQQFHRTLSGPGFGLGWTALP